MFNQVTVIFTWFRSRFKQAHKYCLSRFQNYCSLNAFQNVDGRKAFIIGWCQQEEDEEEEGF